ncbi:MAG: adenine phosphoribosyltransferase [Bdellovibrionales bacterium]|nr:adenine phosphoribosyltransferase [Bdellovibrionales bacterium]
MDTLLDKVRKIPDFPKKGILFYDLTTVFSDPVEFGNIIEAMAEPFFKKKVEVVCAVEARGFILGSALANDLGAGFVPIRKKGKLPSKTIECSYELEYGTDTLEMHEDAILEGQKVLIVDDLLATGGTAKAAVDLVKQCKGEIAGISFVMELMDLKGRENIQDQNIYSLLKV